MDNGSLLLFPFIVMAATVCVGFALIIVFVIVHVLNAAVGEAIGAVVRRVRAGGSAKDREVPSGRRSIG